MKIKAILIFLLFSYMSFGQSPQKFTYQSIIKNSSGYLLKNQDVGLKISVLRNSSNGIEVYSEEHFPTSNSNGLVTLIIGEGLTNDNFSEIQWGDGEYFLKVEVDPEGGNSYIMNQTSQLLSVPYALYAGNSGSKLNLLGQDFITLQDQTLTINKVDLTDDVDGVLPIANGGTGSSTAPMVGVITAVDSPAARVVLGLGTAATNDSSAFATAAQGLLADSAQQPPIEGAFADGDKTKLTNIETSADVTDATNVLAAGAVMTTGDQTVAGAKTFSSTIVGDINGNAATATTLATARNIAGNAFDGSGNITIAAADLSDVTDAGSGAIITDSERTKLTNIETSADVTDTANVTTAGALMDSEVYSLTKIKSAIFTQVAASASTTFFFEIDDLISSLILPPGTVLTTSSIILATYNNNDGGNEFIKFVRMFDTDFDGDLELQIGFLAAPSVGEPISLMIIP